MPNWVYNKVTITGKADKLEALKRQVGASTQIPRTEYVFGEDGKIVLDENNDPVKDPTWDNEEKPVFSMWNITRPSVDEYEDYRDQGWYNWNIRHWGTKWNVSNLDVVQESSEGWELTFDTAWSPPHEALVELSSQHPDVDIRNEWLEEQGFGAHHEYAKGTASLDKQWDIPQSHAEYVENIGDEECPCLYVEDRDDLPFSDCPGAKSDTELAVEELDKVSELI